METGDLIKAATIAAGGLSGGISSTIAGGNFWAGARQGLITSGLNHVAHAIQNKIIVDELLKKGGYNAPQEQITFSTKSLRDFINKIPILRKWYDIAYQNGYSLNAVQDNPEYLGITITSDVKKVNITKSAFSTARKLFLVTGHEFQHVLHKVDKFYNTWLLTGEKYAKAKTEELAWRWTKAMMTGGNTSWMGIDTKHQYYKEQANEYLIKKQ